jgi:L-threonylcarbamoyladenylate synthase
MVTARLPQDEIDQAVEALREGEVVAFPTETVYGLGADAQNPDAVRKIFELKGRPATHPLIVHVEHSRALERWALAVPPSAMALAERFWPGPLTLVLRRAPAVDLAITGGQDTIAIRVPGHPVAQQLLRAFGSGIAAPSANRYGRISPTRAEHVRDEFGGDLRIVLDGGDCKIGLESTIVSCIDATPRILRPGSITLSQLRAVVLMQADGRPCATGTRQRRQALRADDPPASSPARRRRSRPAADGESREGRGDGLPAAGSPIAT